MSRVERNAELYREEIEANAADALNGANAADALNAANASAAHSAETGKKANIRERVLNSKANSGTDLGSSENKLTWQGKLLVSVGTVILALTLILCLFLMVPKFLGIKNYLVASGSMEPTIPVGSMIYSKEVNPVNLAEGDIIVFLKAEEDNVPITHRVLSNDPDAKILITKGDANASLDPMPIQYNNVIGKVIWHTPALGALTAPLTKVTGKAVMLLVVIEGFLFAEVGSRLKKKRKRPAKR